MGISIILSLNILKKWYYLSFTPNNCTKSCKDALAANQIPIYPNRLVPIITPLELFMLSKHEASRQQFPNLKIAQPFGSSQKQKASKNQQLFSLLQQCQTLAKKNKTSTSFPFLQPPTSMVGVTVEVVGVTTPSVVGCSFTFLLQTVTSSCFVRQRFRDCTEGGVLSTSRFLSPWGFGRAGGVGKLGGKGYQGIEVVSSQRFLEDS